MGKTLPQISRKEDRKGMKAMMLSRDDAMTSKTRQIGFRSDEVTDAALEDIKRDSFEKNGVALSTSAAIRKAVLMFQRAIHKADE